MPKPMADERLREIEEWVADESPHGFTEVALTELFEEITRLRSRKTPSVEELARMVRAAVENPDVYDDEALPHVSPDPDTQEAQDALIDWVVAKAAAAAEDAVRDLFGDAP